MEKKLALGLIFGGASSEYEVSLLSSSSVLNHINEEHYDIHKIGITKDGRMLRYDGPVEAISDGSWVGGNCTPCVLSPDRSHHGYILLGGQPEIIRLDCVFPVLHGKNGEDGTIQGLLTLAGIPFVGCGVLACAGCMDKIMTHTILDAAGVPGAKWRYTTETAYRKDEDAFRRIVEQELHYPCFIKPANAGSSVGITKAKNSTDFAAGMELALKHDSRIIVEEAITGMEIECAVLGNEEPVASPLGEIVPVKEFYDYNAKYIDGTTATYVPARISTESAKAIRATAVQAYKAVCCTGLSRVDFFLKEDGGIILNEINTIPGFTSISMYPQLFVAAGISYPELIDRLIALAMERGVV